VSSFILQQNQTDEQVLMLNTQTTPLPACSNLTEPQTKMIFNIIRRRSLKMIGDDSSTSSTLTTCPTKTAIVQASVPAKKANKSVHFDLERNKEYVHNIICQEDCKDLWYSVEDCRRFRGTTQALAQLVRRSGQRQRHGRIVNPSSYQQMLQRTFATCRNCLDVELHDSILVSKAEQECLNRLFIEDPSLVGLERWAVSSIRRDRGLRHKLLMDTVLDIQENAGCSSSDEDFSDVENVTIPYDEKDTEKSIRMHSEAISLPSRLFAYTIALAQSQDV